MDENILIGKIINDIKIASDKKAIKFITDNEDIIVKTDGDCCSSSWIENIELPARGFPAKVKEAANIEMPDLGTPENEECIEYYGFKITTDKGYIIIDYRNSSNGYYGGNLSWPGDYFYGGVFDQNTSNENWINIK